MNTRTGHQLAQVLTYTRELGFVAPASGEWRAAAVCAQVDPELFYPVSVGARLVVEEERAKRVCRGCPVRRECLAQVMACEDPGLRWGVCGGLSPVERSQLFAARRDLRGDRCGEVAA